MSKIGKQPIKINEAITVQVQERVVNISGPKGKFDYKMPLGLDVVIEDGYLKVVPKKKEDKNISAMYGLARALLANMVLGVEKEFEKKLELTGVGYKAKMQGNDLVLSLGFSHPVVFKPREGVKIAVAGNAITVTGIDKSHVGEAAAKIRAVKPPEPYKGKGIKYAGEYIRRKAGKAAKAAGAK